MEFLISNVISFIVILIICLVISFVVSLYKKERSSAKEEKEKNPEIKENRLSKILYYGTTAIFVVYDIVYLPILIILNKMGYGRYEIGLENMDSANPFVVLDNIGMAIIILGIIIKLLLIRKVKYKKADLAIWIIALLVISFIVQITKMA